MSSYLKIKSKLPLNIEETDLKYFGKFIDSKVKIPKIKNLRNVFVNQQGLVLKNGFLARGCAFNLIGKEDNTFYFPFWKKLVEQYLVCRFGNSLKSISLNDDNQYIVIHSAWFNYSFWVNSFLIRLIQFLKDNNSVNENIYLIYPEEWDDISYVNESLSYFNIKVKKIPRDHHIFIKNLILPETREWTSSFYPPTIRNLYDWFDKYKVVKNIKRRIYLSRKARSFRSVENESELTDILQKYNFEIVSFEQVSFLEQMNIMYSASLFISIHGAGFSNIMFMDKGAVVMELINKTYADIEYKFPFWKLADALGLNYLYQFGSVNQDSSIQLIKDNKYDLNEKYLVNENIYIDPILFENNIIKMISYE
jgi:hypothetical protein